MTQPARPLWDRLRGLRPRLAAHARVHRHVYRGEPWYVVEDRAAARTFRLNEEAFALLARMDGTRTLAEVLEQARAGGGENGPDEQSLLDLVGRLRAADLVSMDVPADPAELMSRRRTEQRARRLGALLRPLSMRFPLVDPDRLLGAMAPLGRLVFTWAGGIAWLVTVLGGLALAAIHWDGLLEHASSRLLDPRNLLLLVLAYLVVKTLHELGHGLAVKTWGGEVHEMGVMLLVLFPVPYVDASASNAFASKRKRMAVGGAGILVELLMAALGVALWTLVEPGLVRDLAFDVAVIGGVSTVLYNGNPLLRFDGYYVLGDAIEIPNLGSRSTAFWGYLARRHLLGVKSALSPATAPGEEPWFIGYGLASYCYRVVISLSIALYVASLIPSLGVVIAVWALAAQLLLPLARQLAYLVRSPELAGRRAPRLALVGALVATLLAFVHLVPVPASMVAEGVVRLPEQALVRAGTEGFVREVLAADGETIVAGAPIVALEDEALEARRRVLVLDIEQREVARAASLLSDRTKAQILAEEAADLAEELAEVDADLGKLLVRSPADGRLVVPRAHDAPGRFVRKGDVLAYVRDRAPSIARVVIPERHIDRLRQTRTIEVRMLARPAQGMTARIVRAAPSATGRLPSPALGSRGGGAIAVDARDEEGLTAIEPIFELDLELDGSGPEEFVGGRVLARFERAPEPLARRWARGLRQLLLARL